MAGITAILTPLFGFYNTVFQPLLLMGPYVSLGFFSLALAALFSVLYWWLLDIERADEIKDKLDDYQEKMKEARENDEHEKASDHLKKTLELNQKFMKLNLKPMLATMVFVGLFFPWLGSVYAPTVQMNQTGNATYQGMMEYAGQEAQITVKNTSQGLRVISGETSGGLKEEISAFSMRWQVVKFSTVEVDEYDASLKLNAEFLKLPFSIPLVGGALNWLGFYILIVMPLTYVFRKLLGVQ
ncbi:MAG: EMC3/TMCO1 family protein [Candidatus Nanosalina sp.]